MTGPAAERPLRVLQSFRTPRATTNPYISSLLTALRARPELVVDTFSWRRALTGRYDVVHVHWPEVWSRGSSRLRTRWRQALVAALLLRLRTRRTALVRTVHNPVPHEAGGRLERALLRRVDALTTTTVHLTAATRGTVAPARPAVVVPHGHYREHVRPFLGPTPAEGAAGTLVQFGLLRRYKNAEGLLRAFAATAPTLVASGSGPTRGEGVEAGSSLRLCVAGACPDAGLAADLRGAAAADPRVDLRLHHLDDAELADVVRAAELVVLPYRPTSGEVANSGAALLALSLDRPVLLPRSPATTELAREAGPGWVHLYDGNLGPETLLGALAALRSTPRGARPDLSARDWPEAAEAHVQAYRTAVAQR
ncbi:glycosyl transferase [Kineococcus gynurae]|uniref:Glycosyl transferase n=1 Tax=Kineococcus gynurae TaxID=452979 RepID=A0ABV5LXT9_9ACTN